jgi:Tol biopolymer transport system component
MVVTRTAWSPSGEWIGFILLRDGEPGTVEIVHPDGSGHRRLPTGLVTSDNLGYLAWSPDAYSARIMYQSTTHGIAYFDLATNGEVTVQGGWWPAWSPRGDRIAYWANGMKVIPTPVVNIAGVAPTEVFPSFSGGCPDHPELARKALCGPPIWSPDGRWIMAIDVSLTALMAFPSDGAGDPIVVPLNTPTEAAAGRFFAWQPIYR